MVNYLVNGICWEYADIKNASCKWAKCMWGLGRCWEAGTVKSKERLGKPQTKRISNPSVNMEAKVVLKTFERTLFCADQSTFFTHSFSVSFCICRYLTASKRHAGARLPQGRTISSTVLLECFHGFSQPLSRHLLLERIRLYR